MLRDALLRNAPQHEAGLRVQRKWVSLAERPDATPQDSRRAPPSGMEAVECLGALTPEVPDNARRWGRFRRCFCNRINAVVLDRNEPPDNKVLL